MARFNVVLEGVSDLLQNNCQVMDYKLPKSPEQYPEYLEAQLYRGNDGLLYVPSSAIRNSFIEGLGYGTMKVGKKAAKTVLGGITSIFPEIYVPLLREGKPINSIGDTARTDYKSMKELHEHIDFLSVSAINHNTNAKYGGARIMTHRPFIKLPWELRFVFELDTDVIGLDVNKTSIKQLEDAWRFAGKMVGIGCWRPEKKGLYGKFEISKFEII